MAEGIVIPIDTPGADRSEAVLRSIVAVVDQMARKAGEAGQKTEEAGQKAQQSAVQWTELRSAIGLVVGALGQISAAADRVAELAAEEAHLSAASQRLGLDFDAAAASTSRFVDETVAMQAAEELAAAGYRVTQAELNNLIRVSASYSQATGTDMVQATGQLTQAIMGGSVRALRAFGPELVATAGDAHTVDQRLDALSATARRMGDATDDARTSMDRFRDSIEDSERTAASAFAAELARLSALSARRREATSGLDETTALLRDLGRVAADAVSFVGNAVMALMTEIAMGIAGTVSMARSGIQSLPGLSGAMGGRAAASADAAQMARLRAMHARYLAAMRDALGMTSETSETPAPAAPTPAPGSGQTRPSRADAADRGGVRTSAEARENALWDHVGRLRAPADRIVVPGEAERIRQLDILRAAQERGGAQQREALTREALALQETEAGKAQAAREGAEVERQSSLVGRMESVLQRYGDTSRHVADLVVGSFEDMTSAWGSHLSAVIDGREALGEALQGMLSDTLKAVGKRAGVSAMEEAAAALASLAYGNLPAAGLHAAAAAGFAAVAAAAGYLGQEVAPAQRSTASASAGAAQATPRAADVSPRSERREQGVQITVNFGAPVVAGNPAQAGAVIAGMLRDALVREGVRLPGLVPVGL